MTTHPANMRDHWWWRPGWSVGRRFYTWHLTFEGQDDVQQLASEYRNALAPLGDVLTLIPDRWLHLTMQGIGFVGEVKEQDVRAIVDAARPRLGAVPAFDARIGPVVVDPEAVLLPVHPDDAVCAVRDAVRGAIGEVRGDIPEEAGGFRPHVSVAYSADYGPAQPIIQALDGVGVVLAQARVSKADLIVIHRDNHMYEWEPFATVHLG
ncbi:2'-5' RNA ligase family protein [Streptomyces sp. NPDC006012]|uniref:2'-5' RNA ligase family protein n=1 Tax=Streptomyces sp. NPDC006012 TaxID=3364739 RepID=UPI0036C4D2C1